MEHQDFDRQLLKALFVISVPVVFWLLQRAVRSSRKHRDKQTISDIIKRIDTKNELKQRIKMKRNGYNTRM